jgi:hypothetical protein
LLFAVSSRSQDAVNARDVATIEGRISIGQQGEGRKMQSLKSCNPCEEFF